ncbi:major facilitator superfamily domain-containing protein [Phialemonium atrogriseum]|uniref:Major facilitator superfamily domain-containing protein n=1 Tax=Phialemonium atrogriseum TaxID=1093897 RepID=A0AAJ0BS35_9PEZI|nr:major facilitator superfamily domain-containing protein [Phialemonium atrogriseum]KAK1763022.1 major facilitator superfamily domain-containing protein [Phialemonium atrogriseum]
MPVYETPTNPSEISPLLPSLKQPSYASASTVSLSSESSSSSRNSHSDQASSDDVEATGEGEETQGAKQVDSHKHVIRMISVLLIGIFVAHADGSILMATHPLIASEFNDLTNSTWLITSFVLAGAATQTLYGKLSDIYGRKPVVLAAYSIFAFGCALVGVGQSMWQVILGRVISGAGSSGMTVLVSIIITDLLPLREVAAWRSYVNIVATTGRSLGGPVGGWLADVIGWRWSFFGQVPLILFAIFLCALYLPNSISTTPIGSANGSGGAKSALGQLRRVDFKGSFLLTAVILALLFPLELGGVHIPWTHPLVFSLFAASVVLLALFVFVEKRAPEPIIPLEIFHQRDAVMSYLVMGLQGSAQIAMMFLVPLYFQVTTRTSNAEAGAHLFPAVVGNAVGGLISGVYIKRYGRYKQLCIFATISSITCYILLMLTWHGNTSWWESLYIIPGGFGVGISQSALFISLQVVVDPTHMASAISMMYLSTTICTMTGLVSASAVMQGTLRRGLESRLLGLGLDLPSRQKIISEAVSDVGYVSRTHGAVRTAIVGSYVDSLWYSHGVSLIYSLLAFLGAILLRQKRLDHFPR